MVKLDRNNNIKPALAISWGNIDNLTWEYKLRKGVKFHDGSKFSADDVINFYEKVITAEESQLKPFFNNIEKIEKIDDYKISVKTKQPAPLLNQKLNYLLIGKGNNIGTGNYKYVSFDEKEGLILEAFDDYWGELPYFKKAIFKTIKSKHERNTEFGKGNIDVLTAVPVGFSGVFDDTIKTVPSLEVSFLLFNQNSDLWKDCEIRKIASKVISNDGISNIIGKHSKPINQFVSPGVFGYSLNINEKVYDIEMAQKEIKEIFGQEARKTSLDLTADYKKIGEYIQKEFSKINIRVDLNFFSPQELIERIINKESEMYILGWQSETGDAGDILNSLFMRDAQLNSCLACGSGSLSTEINPLILETNQELNQKKRLA